MPPQPTASFRRRPAASGRRGEPPPSDPARTAGTGSMPRPSAPPRRTAQPACPPPAARRCRAVGRSRDRAPLSATCSTCSMVSSTSAPSMLGGGRPRARAHSSHSYGMLRLTIRRHCASSSGDGSAAPSTRYAAHRPVSPGPRTGTSASTPGPETFAVTDREIDVIATQIDHPCCRNQLQVEAGVGLLEAAQHWDQPGDRQRWRQRQAHGGAIGGRQDGLRRCLDLPDRRIDALQVPPPDLGQRQVPARAIEQLGLQKAFELPHLMADGGLGTPRLSAAFATRSWVAAARKARSALKGGSRFLKVPTSRTLPLPASLMTKVLTRLADCNRRKK